MHGSDSRISEVDWPSLCLFKHVVIVVVHYDERASERINRGFCILFIYLFVCLIQLLNIVGRYIIYFSHRPVEPAHDLSILSISMPSKLNHSFHTHTHTLPLLLTSHFLYIIY